MYFKYMQNVENLLPIQVYAESGKSTLNSSICRMWKIYFQFKYAECGESTYTFDYMQNVENLFSIEVYAECGKSVSD